MTSTALAAEPLLTGSIFVIFFTTFFAIGFSPSFLCSPVSTTQYHKFSDISSVFTHILSTIPGALGSSILKIARLLCDHIIVADVVDDKLEAAKANGATHTINVLKENLIEKVKEYTYGHGATVSIDAVCNKDSLINLLQATGNAGRVMTMGFSTAPTEINQFLITSKELDVRGSRLQNKMFGKAIELVNEGKLDLTNSISHTFPLTKAQEAFDFVDSHDPSIRKIVLTFDF